MPNNPKLPDRDSKGKLPTYIWPGCYPMLYIDKQGNTLCSDCASRDIDQSQDVIAADVNWENPDLICDDCGKRIESAYAEDEATLCTTCSPPCLKEVHVVTPAYDWRSSQSQQVDEDDLAVLSGEQLLIEDAVMVIVTCDDKDIGYRRPDAVLLPMLSPAAAIMEAATTFAQQEVWCRTHDVSNNLLRTNSPSDALEHGTLYEDIQEITLENVLQYYTFTVVYPKGSFFTK